MVFFRKKLNPLFTYIIFLPKILSFSYSNQPWSLSQCNSNIRQSPININTKYTEHLDHYYDEIEANTFVSTNLRGVHQVQMNNISSELTRSIKFSFLNPPENDQLKCAQIHCHFNSAEHKVDGTSFFGECHVVCFSKLYKDLAEAVASKYKYK